MGIFRSGGKNANAKLNAIANMKSVNVANLAGTTTCTSLTYINMPTGASIANFAKVHNDTVLVIWMNTNWYTTVANTEAQYGVQIGGIDYDIVHHSRQEASSWGIASGVSNGLSSIAAGSYTIQGRWKRLSGTGTLIADNQFSMMVMEVQQS